MAHFHLNTGHWTYYTNNTNNPWTRVRPVPVQPLPQPKRNLEVVKDDTPIMAHRNALLKGVPVAPLVRWTGTSTGNTGVDRYLTAARELYVAPEPEFQLSSVTGTQARFDRSGMASCRVLAAYMELGRDNPLMPHSAPDPDCTCGWYALPLGVRAPTYDHDRNYVDVLVELSGRVIEHESGYRAQHQQVLEVCVGQCWCGNDDVVALGFTGGGNFYHPVCRVCYKLHYVENSGSRVWNGFAYDLDLIAKKLGVPVTVRELH